MATSSRRRVDPDAEMPSAAVLRRLKLSPEVAWYMVSRGIPLPAHPPKIKTPEPRSAAALRAQFDAARVDRVLDVFHELRHTKGRLAGSPLDPDPWQVAYLIAPVFGWVHRNDYGDLVRVITTLYVDVPRKNGKSTIAGGLGLYLTCSDNEAGAEVLAAATTREQAGFVFSPVQKIASSSPALRGKVKAGATRITHPRTGSYFQVVSSAGDAQHGGNIHGAVVDELHLHRNGAIVEAIETGTGSRDQPLIVFITTADEGKPNTVYAQKRKLVEDLAARITKDPTTYGVVFAADDGDDPHAELTWAKANPGYPISPTKRYLEKASANAKNSPLELASFLRLHLGIRTKQRARYITLRDWDRNAGRRIEPYDESLRGREAFGGFDLASASDLTSLCWLLPQTVELDGAAAEGFRAIWHNWIPEAALEALDARTNKAASQWVQDGFLTLTPGDVTDYDWIEQQILKDSEFYDVRSIGFDPYNSTHLVNNLMDEGMPMVRVRQGFLTLSPPLKEIHRLVRRGRKLAPLIEHGSNPVARWAIDNLAVAKDAADNVKPDKEHANDKIDPVSALATAMSEALSRAQEPRSAYAGADPMFVRG